MKALLPVLVLCLACRISLAGSAPPLESLLERAENVVLARVASVSGTTVTFQRVELLRGKTPVEVILGQDDYGGAGVSFEVGSEFLLISQGDAKSGPPRPMLGRPMLGQGSWCGWSPLPISRIGNQIFAHTIYSSVDGQPSTDGPPDNRDAKLALPRIKRLVERFPYQPRIRDKE
jgi:hypothetical protein